MARRTKADVEKENKFLKRKLAYAKEREGKDDAEDKLEEIVLTLQRALGSEESDVDELMSEASDGLELYAELRDYAHEVQGSSPDSDSTGDVLGSLILLHRSLRASFGCDDPESYIQVAMIRGGYVSASATEPEAIEALYQLLEANQ